MEPTQTAPIVVHSRNWFKLTTFLYLILSIGATATAIYLYFEPCKTTERPQNTAQQQAIAEPETEKVAWLETNIMGSFKFNYPKGWHVTNSFPSPESPTLAIINPNPINTAPRGGPIGEIVISYSQNPKDAEEYFKTRKEDLEVFTGNKPQVLAGKIGPVYYYKGISDIMGQKMETETYLMQFTWNNTPQFVEVSNNPITNAYSDYVREVALSIEKIER